MCRAVKCKTCGKTTWAGCGEHVAQVRSGVAKGDWCDGHEQTSSGGGWLSRLVSRR